MAFGRFYFWRLRRPGGPAPAVWAGQQIQLTAWVWGRQQIRGIEADGAQWTWRTESKGFWFRALGHAQGPRPPVHRRPDGSLSLPASPPGAARTPYFLSG